MLCAPVTEAQTESTIVSALKAPVSTLDRVLDQYFPYEERIAGWVDNSARLIDEFFGTSDAWRTDNDSWLRITSDFRWDQIDHGSVELRPRIKMDLPTANKRLHLLIENDSPEQRTATQEAVPSLNRTDEQRTTAVGFGLDMDNWAKAWKKQFQVGVNGFIELNPYTRFIAKRTWQLGGDWDLRSYNRLAWFGDDGYSAKSEIRFGEPLAKDWRMDFTTDLAWREKRDYLEFAESASFTNIVNERSAISYTLGAAGTGADNPEITSYFIAADYRRNVSRRLIFVDVIPELSFPKEENFDPHWAITLRLELYFQKSVSRHD